MEPVGNTRMPPVWMYTIILKAYSIVLAQGRYTWRHNQVLRELTDVVELIDLLHIVLRRIGNISAI